MEEEKAFTPIKEEAEAPTQESLCHPVDMAKHFIGFIERDIEKGNMEIAFNILITEYIKEQNYSALFDLLKLCLSVHEIMKFESSLILRAFDQIEDVNTREKYIELAKLTLQTSTQEEELLSECDGNKENEDPNEIY